MIPETGIMIWLVKSMLVDFIEINIWQIFVTVHDSYSWARGAYPVLYESPPPFLLPVRDNRQKNNF